VEILVLHLALLLLEILSPLISQLLIGLNPISVSLLSILRLGMEGVVCKLLLNAGVLSFIYSGIGFHRSLIGRSVSGSRWSPVE